MNIREIGKPTTAKTLNETLAKRFGKKVDLESFTITQLEDARNKLRTKLSQVETNEKFESVHSSDEYQKSKLFLDVLNAEILERERMPDFIEEKNAKPDFLDLDKDGDKKEPMKKAAKDAKKKPVGEDQIDEFGGVDSQDQADVNLMKAIQKKFGTKSGRNLGRVHGDRYGKSSGKIGGALVPADMDVTLDDPAVKMMIDAGILTLNPSALKQYKAMKKVQGESTVREGKDQGKAIIENYFKSLLEGKEDEAEIVMAAKDMVDRVTNWMEDTAEMQAESMLELGDAIRDEMGQEKSDAFIAAVKPALESLYTSLESTRGTLTGGVAQLTGEGAPAQDMGAEGGEEPIPAETDADMEPTVDQEDDFSASEPAAGGEEEAGRDKRESKIMKRNVLETSRRLGTILSKKK